MTAYRQQATLCAAVMIEQAQPSRDLSAVPDAAKILLRNVYGWFERVERERYGFTDAGRPAIGCWYRAR